MQMDKLLDIRGHGDDLREGFIPDHGEPVSDVQIPIALAFSQVFKHDVGAGADDDGSILRDFDIDSYGHKGFDCYMKKHYPEVVVTEPMREAARLRSPL